MVLRRPRGMPLLPLAQARSGISGEKSSKHLNMKFYPYSFLLISVRGSVLRLAAPEGGGRGGGAHAAQPRDLPGEDGEARGAAQEDARGTQNHVLVVHLGCGPSGCDILQSISSRQDVSRLTTC